MADHTQDTTANPTPLANAFHVSLPKQQVLVWGPSLPPFETVTEKIAKTGKEILAKEEVREAAKLPGLDA
jgi:copper chaperone